MPVAPSNPLLEQQVARVLGTKPKAVEEQSETDAQQELLDEFRKRKLVAESISDALVKSLKPKGYFNIPDLLDQKRLKYGIPNGAFMMQPAFDKVFVWPIPVREGDTFTDGGLIQKPDSTIAYERNTAPKGVIVSCGFKAMDSLYSTGFEIGHTIFYKKFAAFMLPVEEILGHKLTVTVIRDGDVEASCDLADQIHAKHGEVRNISETGYDFRYVLNGKVSGEKVSGCYDASI